MSHKSQYFLKIVRDLYLVCGCLAFRYPLTEIAAKHTPLVRGIVDCSVFRSSSLSQ
jgi:hypothetical protein